MTATAQHVSSSLSLSITNPLVLYRALLATRRIRPDPAQHRLALELQKLYYRLKDYDPEIEYRWRLERAAKCVGTSSKPNAASHRAVFNHGPTTKLFGSLLGLDHRAASVLALTRTTPVHDSAMEIDSPQGMLLYGEVGRGKSMLLDLLYSALPTKKKRRWHFNTFILDIFRRLEKARMERTRSAEGLLLEHEHVVLSLAKDTMETSPILFLDEFQMPDRVSGKLVNSFFTSFFSLGGVLVASSNRMPEELAKASGVEFSRMGGVQARWGRGGQFWEKLSIGQRQARNDFGMFVEVLKKRCDVWEMEGERDWRREDGEMSAALDAEESLEEMEQEVAEAVLDTLSEASAAPSLALSAEPDTSSADKPLHYHIINPPSPESPLAAPSPALQIDIKKLNQTAVWTPITLTVYARPLTLSTTHMPSGLALLPFPQLCQASLGSADYITVCSTFHTLIVTDIPILTLTMKNEARRFITFLDACYEARCRLIIEAAAPPDRLFFPETRTRRGALNSLAEGDSIESEAFSEMYQDSTAPFRPNVSSYVGANENERQNEAYASQPSASHQDLRSVLADEDADFGPTYGNRRSNSGMSYASDDYADEDQRDVNLHANGRPGSMLDERHNLFQTGPIGMSELEQRQGPDFTQGAGVFTGQDEQFAYKRARSRLWEMCGRRWWEERTKRPPAEWWTPVQRDSRFWEKGKEAVVSDIAKKQGLADGEGTFTDMTGTHNGGPRKIDVDVARKAGSERGELLFKHGASPFRTSEAPPPKFGWQHAWGMMRWGRKAGEWGKGIEGDRTREKDRDDGKDRDK